MSLATPRRRVVEQTPTRQLTPLQVHLTPLGDLRRRTLLASATPLRRSSILPQGSPVVEIIPDKDDEEEIRRKRSLQQRRSVVPSPQKALNHVAINQQYRFWKNLFMENKITISNAWDVPIREFLQVICNAKTPNFLREASISLDISSKVYGLRVDSLYEVAMSLMQSLNRARENRKDDVLNENNEGEAGREGSEKEKVSPKKKKKKHSRGKKATIADSQALYGFKYLQKLPPNDYTNRIDSDSGHINSLYTNALKEEDVHFIILNMENTLFSSKDPLVQKTGSTQTALLPQSLPHLSETLTDFKVDENQENLDFYPNSDMSFNLPPTQDLVRDEDGILYHENVEPLDDVCENNHDSEDENEGIEVRNQQPVYVTSLLKSFRTNYDSDYSFNPIVLPDTGKFIDKIWAGPSHWKLKFIRKPSAARVPPVNVGSKKKKLHVIEPIEDFVIAEDIPGGDAKEIKALKIARDDKITFPLLDLNENLANPFALMLRPRMVLKSGKNGETINEFNDATSVGHHENDEMNDAEFVTSPNDDDNQENHEVEVDTLSQQCAHYQGNDNLIDAPQIVQRAIINFPRRAKPINIKKMKESIYKCLTDGQATNDEETSKVHQSFSVTYPNLYNSLSSKEKEGLNPSVAFVGLLHLVHEKSLNLEADPNCKNFGNFFVTSG